jgi:hypothetical protein
VSPGRKHPLNDPGNRRVALVEGIGSNPRFAYEPRFCDLTDSLPETMFICKY